ncbi:MAG: ankyrin repeat domain-containing protein [Ignavibacteria bacterium]|nr:ankyrin repeat domain-containing protein [Ignavibacteria bacterium]
MSLPIYNFIETMNYQFIMRCLLCLLCLLCLSCTDRDSVVDKSKLLGNDYRLFQGTPVWNLAKAVQDENTSEIIRLVRDEKVNINFQESKYGQTLLMLSIVNLQYSSCKTLLEVGADVNIHDTYSGKSAIIIAAAVFNDIDDNTRFVKLLLSHGADPSDAEVGDRKHGHWTRFTPLTYSTSISKTRLPIVKVLVEAGANINYRDENNFSALSSALLASDYEVVLFLLQKGADYKSVIVDRAKYSETGSKVYIQDLLREHCLPLNSKEYLQKMAVVEFLKAKGIDYSKVPIPDFVVKKAKTMYPKDWQQYLEKN